MNKYQTFTTRQTYSVVNSFIKNFMKDNILPEIKQRIRDELINRKIQTYGIKEVTKSVFQKIIHEIDAQRLGLLRKDQKHLQKQQESYQRKQLRRMFRKSCDDIHSFRENQIRQKMEKSSKWLKQYIEHKKQIQLFQSTLHSQNNKQKTQKRLKSYKKLHKRNFTNHNLSNGFQTTTSTNFRARQNQNHLQQKYQNLIKLHEQIQKQDIVIIKKRQNILKKKKIQKQFQQTFQKQEKLAEIVVKNTMQKVILPSNYTTDYDGQLIEMHNNYLLGYQKNKKYSIFKDKTNNHKNKGQINIKKKYETMRNSPVHSSRRQIHQRQIRSKVNISEHQQKQLFADQNYSNKDKIRVKFKIRKQNIVEALTTPQSQIINLNNSKAQQSSAQNSSDQNHSNGINSPVNPKNNQQIVKSSKMFQPNCDYNTLINNIELSNGVTMDNVHINSHSHHKNEKGNKENQISYKINTIKSIKSISKSLKFVDNLLYKDDGLKNISLVNKPSCIKNSDKGKKVENRKFSILCQK